MAIISIYTILLAILVTLNVFSVILISYRNKNRDDRRKNILCKLGKIFVVLFLVIGSIGIYMRFYLDIGLPFPFYLMPTILAIGYLYIYLKLCRKKT